MLRPNEGRALERLGDANHMRQLLPSDYDSFSGIFGSLERIGDNKGNCVSDMTHLVTRQDNVGRYVEDGVWELYSAWQRAEIACLGSGEHKAHAWHRPRLRGVDIKARMRVGRP